MTYEYQFTLLKSIVMHSWIFVHITLDSKSMFENPDSILQMDRFLHDTGFPQLNGTVHSAEVRRRPPPNPVDMINIHKYVLKNNK